MTTNAFVRPEHRKAWQQLQTLADAPSLHLRDLLKLPGRHDRLQYEAAGLSLDASHQRVNADILSALHALAEESLVLPKAQAMFRGEHINTTEDRAVLHVALRGSTQPSPPWGEALARTVSAELSRYTGFAQALRSGQVKGHAGEAITDVVNLGIGGSDLGPRMATEALQPCADPTAPSLVQVHYVSNVDVWQLAHTLSSLSPARTLFVVQSKTFTTQETMTLFNSAKRWLTDGGCPPEQCQSHLVAVTAKPGLAQSLGFHADRCFQLWDWVGGRYSLWSAIGLPLVVATGATAYLQMLAGAHAMDQHFLQTPTSHNMPVMMALFGIWNRNFLGADTHHVAPYHSALSKLVPFLQQQDMESNGKRVHLDGSLCSVATSPILWGGLGNDGQHAYFQLLHQGSHLVPVDFIGVRQGHQGLPLSEAHQRVVLLNMQAQAQALAQGRTHPETLAQLRQEGLSAELANQLATHRSFAGNVPSSTLWLAQLTPFALGALIALYEHKVFCQAAIWGINAYDQWGVELGKTMALAIEKDKPKPPG